LETNGVALSPEGNGHYADRDFGLYVFKFTGKA
jgi:hypothetical protein